MSDERETPSSSSANSVGAMLREMGRKLAQGEAGTLLVLIMVAVIWTFFQLQNSRFLSPGNLTNLMLQQAAVATISIGVVLVLLLGWIDLSVGAVSGFCASVMAVLVVSHHVPSVLAVLIALALGALIGLFNGFMSTRFRIPAFIITLAGSLTLVGLQLYVLGQTGTVNLSDKFITGLTSTFFPPLVGWIAAVLAIAITLGLSLLGRARRQAAGLKVDPMSALVLRTAATGAAFAAMVFVVNKDRGLPLVTVIVFGLALATVYLTEHTRF
ncbi:MAG TPA: sugar ABC transporter permease, partial [Coriobacteriia bacterium]|nr:sugar ABC transporter permease [Coriobacteriia bacterium]